MSCFTCPVEGCNADLDWQWSDTGMTKFCPSCGTGVALTVDVYLDDENEEHVFAYGDVQGEADGTWETCE